STLGVFAQCYSLSVGRLSVTFGGYAHVERTDSPKAVRFRVRNRCLTHSAPSVQSPPSRSCPQQQRSVVHYALESFRLAASFECIRGSTGHRPFRAIRDTTAQRIRPLLLSDFAAGSRSRESLLSCALVRCAPIRETSFSRASALRD